MLLEKKVGVGDIVSLKLISGEELIGKVKDSTSSGFMINKPLVLNVVAVPAPDGTMQHALSYRHLCSVLTRRVILAFLLQALSLM